MFSVAESYDGQMGSWSKLLAPEFVEFVDVRDGESALDVGCGTGSLAFTIARTRKVSKVVGIDPSEGFIDYARSHNTDPRLSFDVGDAENLPYPDASFNRCLSSLMINYVPDAAKGVREMARVTRPDGVVATCAWDTSGGMDLFRGFYDTVVALDPAAEPRHPRNRPPTVETVSDLWRTGGLLDIAVKDLVVPLEFSSFDNLWLGLLNNQGLMGAHLGTLSEDGKRSFKQRLRQELLGSRPDRPFALKAKAVAVRGIVPDQ